MHKFGLFFDTLEALQAAHAKLMGGAIPPGPAAPPAPPAPVATPPAPPAPPAPPMPSAPVMPPPAPVPTAPAAPPAPPAPVAAPIVPPTAAAPGAPDLAKVIEAMGRVITMPGGATKLAPIMAQYNAQQPGVAGPATTVDPAQYTNLINALNAVA